MDGGSSVDGKADFDSVALLVMLQGSPSSNDTSQKINLFIFLCTPHDYCWCYGGGVFTISSWFKNVVGGGNCCVIL